MPTAVEDVLELSPPARRILADVEVRRHAFPYENHSLDKKLSYPQRKRASSMAILYGAEDISI